MNAKLLKSSKPDVRKKLLAIQEELNSSFLEREDIAEGVVLSLLTKSHVFLLGLPGTAKSAILEAIGKRIQGANYWSTLVTKTSVPEEFFGPLAIPELKNGKYVRVPDGTIRQAHFAFLDEVFKAGGTILNPLLNVLNERVYRQGGNAESVPLQTAFLASNELPEDTSLKAFFDRVVLRYEAKRLQAGSSLESLILGNGKSSNYTTLTLAELDQAQKEVKKVKIDPALARDLARFFLQVRREGIDVSERSIVQTVGDTSIIDGSPIASLIKAAAWLRGSDTATDDDIDVLAHCYWQSVEEQQKLAELVAKVGNPYKLRAQQLKDEAREIGDVSRSAGTDQTDTHTKNVTKLKRVAEMANQLINEAERKGHDHRVQPLHDTLDFVKDQHEEVVALALGRDVEFVREVKRKAQG